MNINRRNFGRALLALAALQEIKAEDDPRRPMNLLVPKPEVPFATEPPFEVEFGLLWLPDTSRFSMSPVEVSAPGYARIKADPQGWIFNGPEVLHVPISWKPDAEWPGIVAGWFTALRQAGQEVHLFYEHLPWEKTFRMGPLDEFKLTPRLTFS